MSEAFDNLMAGGGKSAKFDTPGDSVTGVIVDTDSRQVTDINSGKGLTWDDGRPRMQAVIAIQTDERADAEDDGVRNVYIKGWGDQMKALRACGGKPEVGDTFTATFIGEGVPHARGFSAPKLYKYALVKGAPGAAAPAPAAAQIAPAAPAPYGYQAVAQAPLVTPPAPATVPEPAPLAAPVAAQPGDPAGQIRSLIGVGLDDAQIAAATNVDLATIAALRSLG